MTIKSAPVERCASASRSRILHVLFSYPRYGYLIPRPVLGVDIPVDYNDDVRRLLGVYWRDNDWCFITFVNTRKRPILKKDGTPAVDQDGYIRYSSEKQSHFLLSDLFLKYCRSDEAKDVLSKKPSLDDEDRYCWWFRFVLLSGFAKYLKNRK